MIADNGYGNATNTAYPQNVVCPVIEKEIEPENEFERAIIEFCRELAKMLIMKNRLYGDSFRNIRKSAKKDLNNPRIPLWLHMMEKLSRYMKNQPDETEDIVKDGAGYWILEAICARMDDALPDLANEENLKV